MVALTYNKIYNSEKRKRKKNIIDDTLHDDSDIVPIFQTTFT